MRPSLTAAIAAVGLAGGAWSLTACGDAGQTGLPSADAQRGHGLIVRYGCGSCHTIDGVDLARGKVGPALTSFKSNRFLAGALPNTPANAARWISAPQQIQPQTIMPNLGISRRDALDIAAYLYTQ